MYITPLFYATIAYHFCVRIRQFVAHFSCCFVPFVELWFQCKIYAGQQKQKKRSRYFNTRKKINNFKRQMQLFNFFCAKVKNVFLKQDTHFTTKKVTRWESCHFLENRFSNGSWLWIMMSILMHSERFKDTVSAFEWYRLKAVRYQSPCINCWLFATWFHEIIHSFFGCP